jgi:transposase
MSSLVKKSIKGNQYYYIVDSKRINGKPRVVNQVYIGSVDSVIELLKESKGIAAPLYSSVLDFGAAAALYDVAERLDIINIIDGIAAKRKQGLSVGTYLLIAAINRAVNPTSKSDIGKWYEKTILSSLIPASGKQLCCQRFWDNMCKWTDDDIQKFEEIFIPSIIKRYHLSTKCLVYDATNFFTYIDTGNDKADTAQRGHSKEKRNDLRIVGLSLMLSGEDEIPLFYDVYEGNRNDSKQFSEVINRLKKRYRDMFGENPDITLVFDRGNNSKDNINLLQDTEKGLPFHYVGGLKSTQSRELYKIPKQEYTGLKGEEFKGTKAYRIKTTAFGREVTAVVTDNPELTKGQLKSILKNREACHFRLKEYQEKLNQWENGEITKGRKPTPEGAKEKITGILSTEYMERLFIIEWEKEGRTYPGFHFTMPESRLLELEENELGKSVLFTDHDDWENEKIVHAYRSAWRIESAFRQMKDTEHLSVRPMWHWTDQKIKVHIFCCILAYRLCCILKRELREKGMDLSINGIIDKLSSKQQVINYYPKSRGLKEIYSMTRVDEQTERMIELQGLEKYQLKS